MAYTIEAGSFCEFKMQGKLHDQIVMATFHYRNEEETSDGNGWLAAAMTQFRTLVVSQLCAGLSEDFKEIIPTAQWIYPVRYHMYTYTGPAQAGAVVDAACPSGTSIVVKRQAQRAGRQYQGRIYVPGCPIGAEANSVLKPSWCDDNQTNFEGAMMAPLDPAGLGIAYPVIFNLKAPANWSFIEFSNLDTILRYQRRREVRVGI